MEVPKRNGNGDKRTSFVVKNDGEFTPTAEDKVPSTTSSVSGLNVVSSKPLPTTQTGNKNPINDRTATYISKITVEPQAPIQSNYVDGTSSSRLKAGNLHIVELSDDRIQYEREFLLHLRSAPASMAKPEGLPDIPDVIHDAPVVSADRHTPLPAAGAQDVSKTKVKHRASTPSAPQSQDQSASPLLLPLDPQAPNQSKKVSKRKSQKVPTGCTLELGKKQPTKEEESELYGKTRSILDILTPHNFQTLVSEMRALRINTETMLNGVVDLIYEKAVNEPNHSVAYANMCKCLSKFKVPAEKTPETKVNFRAVLLTWCQHEFRKDIHSEAVFKQKRQDIETAEESRREEMKTQLEQEECEVKRRSLGNVRFLGELFKLNMLTENVLHDCVFKLLRIKGPHNLECLYCLLTTIGKELDVPKSKPRMDQYFQQMQKIANDKKMPPNVRALLQDVIELRLNRWMPLRVDTCNPKTCDKIHKEVEQEVLEKDLELATVDNPVSTVSSFGHPFEDIVDRLNQLIVVHAVASESVIAWIKFNVHESTTKQPKFIRALVTAVCNNAVTGERGKERVGSSRIRERSGLLLSYFNHQPVLELQALYALQAFVTSLGHPPGVLRRMFDILYDEDIISQDAFIQWEKSDDEPGGKKETLQQVVQFFALLRKDEDDD